MQINITEEMLSEARDRQRLEKNQINSFMNDPEDPESPVCVSCM
jgi:hypothetical protein